MAWTEPRTWVDGDIVSPAMLNTEIRDNLLVVSQHAHDGTAGEGADDLSGVDTITLDDGTAPAAPGASKTVVWAEGGRLQKRAGASGAAEELSVTGHAHAVSEEQANENVKLHSFNSNPELILGGDLYTTSYQAGSASTNRNTITKVNADNAVVISGAAICFNSTNNQDFDSTMRIVAGGVQRVTHTVTDIDDNISYTGWFWHHAQYTATGESAASHDYDIQFKHNGANPGNLAVAFSVVHVTEVTDA